MNSRQSRPFILAPVVLALIFIAGFLCSQMLTRSGGKSDIERKFQSVLNIISSQYVDPVSIDSLLEATFPLLMSNLDPHSSYISANDIEAVNGELEGSFSGVGIQFAIQNDTIIVVEAINDGPSQAAGIKAGDRIVAIDGVNVAGTGITNDEVFNKLRGERGTDVVITIKPYSSRKTTDYTITRDNVAVTSIDAAYMATDNIGYIRINKFGSSTYNEFYDALNNLAANGAKDFVIDLRSNTGGFMEMAILMANEFFERGTPIVFTRGRESTSDEYVISDGYGKFKDARVAVLIDEISASSSEIFSGAIQDNDRGLIIGRRSFGKGLVQRQIELPDGSALHLTIARYYTPSGRCIQKDYSDVGAYEFEILDRYKHGEAYAVDSIRLNTDDVYNTLHGRPVFGGGGIMPDIFVPNDTIGVTKYYIDIANAGILQKYALEFVDMNRESLEEAIDVADLYSRLPSDYTLLRSLVAYAAENKIPARWSQINNSHSLIVNQLKALIARDAIGMDAYFEIINSTDPTVLEAIKRIEAGEADYPVKTQLNAAQPLKP